LGSLLKGLRGTLASIGDQTNKRQIYDGFQTQPKPREDSQAKAKQSKIDLSPEILEARTFSQKTTRTSRRKVAFPLLSSSSVSTVSQVIEREKIYSSSTSSLSSTSDVVDLPTITSFDDFDSVVCD